MSFLWLSVKFLRFTIVDSDWRTKRMQQFGGGHPVKSAGVLGHGHWMSPYVVNHFIVNDYIPLKSWPAINNILHKWLIKKKKKGSIHFLFTSLHIPISSAESSEHSHCKSCSSKFSRISIITNGCLDRFFAASFLVLKYIYKKHLFLLQSSHCSFLASHTYICNKNVFFMSPEWDHMLTKPY